MIVVALVQTRDRIQMSVVTNPRVLSELVVAMQTGQAYDLDSWRRAIYFLLLLALNESRTK